MRKFIKISLLIILALAIYSLIPTVTLYLKKDPAPYTNEEAAEKLKNNKGDYFAFIAFGDNHSGFPFTDSACLKLIKHMNREDRFKKIPIDFVVNLGDIAFINGTEWDYKTYSKLRKALKWPVVTVTGNHDDDEIRGLVRFTKYIGAKELAFGNRNSYFILLDNRLNNLSEGQFAWFESQLTKSSGYQHRFVFLHKSPLSLYQQSWFRPELSPWSYRFMKLCEKYKVDIVFAGHEHMFREGRYGSVAYIVSGGGGMFTQIPASAGGFLHYLVVRVYGDYVDYEVRKIFPPLWEYLTYYLWKDIFYFLKDVVF